MILYEFFCVHIRMRSHHTELVLLCEHFLYLITEQLPDFLLPLLFLQPVVAGIERNHKKEIHIIMTDKQRVAVKKPVPELL